MLCIALHYIGLAVITTWEQGRVAQQSPHYNGAPQIRPQNYLFPLTDPQTLYKFKQTIYYIRLRLAIHLAILCVYPVLFVRYGELFVEIRQLRPTPAAFGAPVGGDSGRSSIRFLAPEN